MTPQTLFIALFAVAFASRIHAEDLKSSKEPERLFRQVSVDEAAGINVDHALVMGTYVLDAKATEQLLQVDTLMKAFNRIRLTDWKAGAWTKENAELTIRQRMDDYIQTAQEFYTGNGKRPQGIIGKRLEKFTDTELGDRQLASALTSVRMAAAWDIPLGAGQAERLNSVLRVRLAMIKDVIG